MMEAPRGVDAAVGSLGVLSGATGRSRVAVSLGFCVGADRSFLSAAQ